jgi:uncharacterized OB-fold protein
MSERPLPRPTALSQPHWEGCRAGVLRVQRCRACGTHVFIPQPLCTRCFHDGLEWVESAGNGSVYSFTVVHRAPHPAFATPYLVSIVALDEGFEMLANLECPLTRAAIGMRVRAAFRAASNEISLPYFVPL